MRPHHSSHPSQATRPPLHAVPSSPAEPASTPLREALVSMSWRASAVEDLARLVGGIDELERLEVVPLPEEPFDWAPVRADDRAIVAQVVDAIDRAAEREARDPDDGVSNATPRARFMAEMAAWQKGRLAAAIDVEYVTIARRLLALVAARSPGILRRADPVRTAAGLVWLAMHGNGAFERRLRTFTADELWSGFGVSNCSERGRSLRQATGLVLATDGGSGWAHRPTGDTWLPDVRLLHSRTRRSLLARREDLLTRLRDDAARELERRPVRPTGDGRLRLRARPVTPRLVFRSTTDEGRAVVLALFGEDHDPMNADEVLGLSVPDARRLVSLLQHALDGPLVQSPSG